MSCGEPDRHPLETTALFSGTAAEAYRRERFGVGARLLFGHGRGPRCDQYPTCPLARGPALSE